MTDDILACHAINISQEYAEREKLVKHYLVGEFSKTVEEFGRARVTECVKNLEQDGIGWITIKCKDYPERLLNLPDPPYVLYTKGNKELLKKPSISIVGMRESSTYGNEITEKWAHEFTSRGVVVVSGLADGIDRAAHVGAGSKNTIAVLGNGINYYYPSGNVALQNEIGEKGLLLSEYLPPVRCTKFTFPHRNRLVAALSKVLLIAEAGNKSGTMITKDIALDLGNDIFAIPGPVNSVGSIGTNDLIKRGEALVATEPDDVLNAMGSFKKSSKPNVMTQVSFEEQQILDVLGGSGAHFDDIIETTHLPIAKLSTLLTNMEVSGLLKKLPGNMYVGR